MRSVIITGATGPLGMALIKLLTDKCIYVTVIVRESSEKTDSVMNINAEYVRVVECDLSNLLYLRNTLQENFDVFFHFGWMSSKQNRADVKIQMENIRYSLDAVELAHKINCPVFIGAGSQSEINLDNNANQESYGVAKQCACKLCKNLCGQYGIRFGWLRIFSMYGPYDRNSTFIMYCIRILLSGKKPSVTKCEQIWDYIYSEDCARAFYLLALYGKHGDVYNLGGGEPRPLKDYAEILRDSIDKELPIGFGELAYPPGQIMNMVANISALKDRLGYEPEYTFSQGIKETIEWLKNTQVYD